MKVFIAVIRLIISVATGILIGIVATAHFYASDEETFYYGIFFGAFLGVVSYFLHYHWKRRDGEQ